MSGINRGVLVDTTNTTEDANAFASAAGDAGLGGVHVNKSKRAQWNKARFSIGPPLCIEESSDQESTPAPASASGSETLPLNRSGAENDTQIQLTTGFVTTETAPIIVPALNIVDITSNEFSALALSNNITPTNTTNENGTNIATKANDISESEIVTRSRSMTKRRATMWCDSTTITASSTPIAKSSPRLSVAPTNNEVTTNGKRRSPNRSELQSHKRVKSAASTAATTTLVTPTKNLTKSNSRISFATSSNLLSSPSSRKLSLFKSVQVSSTLNTGSQPDRSSRRTSLTTISNPKETTARRRQSVSLSRPSTASKRTSISRGHLRTTTTLPPASPSRVVSNSSFLLLDQSRVEIEELSSQNQQLTAQVNGYEINTKSLESDLRHFRSLCDEYELKNRQLSVELEASAASTAVLRTALQAESHLVTEAKREINALKAQLELAETQNKARAAELLKSETLITSLRNQVQSMDTKARADELYRKRLHNAIVELKGNIRVFCRLRPLTLIEKAQAATAAQYTFPDSRDHRTIEVFGREEKSVDGLQNNRRKHVFEFDHAFDANASQAEIYDEMSSIVLSAVDGYRCCVFAYGQTSSGS